MRTKYIVDWYMYTVLLQARDLIYAAYESLVMTHYLLRNAKPQKDQLLHLSRLCRPSPQTVPSCSVEPGILAA